MNKDAWFRQMPGLMVANEEKTALNRILKTMRGNDLLQIGSIGDASLIEQTHVLRSFCIETHANTCHSPLFIQANTDCLPVQSDSMDIVLLMHSLESTYHPKLILEEVYRVLRPYGQLIIFGFNRWSLWQLYRLWMQKKYYAEMKKCYSAWEIKRLLCATDFTILQERTLCFRPLLKNRAHARAFFFLEPLGQFLLPDYGGIMLIHAIKQVRSVTPLVAPVKCVGMSQA